MKENQNGGQDWYDMTHLLKPGSNGHHAHYVSLTKVFYDLAYLAN